MNIRLFALVNLFIVSSLCAAGTVWQNQQDIGFEIRNHDSKPITVTLKASDTPMVNLARPIIDSLGAIIWKTVVPGKRFLGAVPSLSKRLDITEPLFLTVEYTDQAGNPAFKHYTFSPNKTVFVAWENNSLRPQRGTKEMTQSGLSLALNVRPHDIQIYDFKQNDYVLNK